MTARSLVSRVMETIRLRRALLCGSALVVGVLTINVACSQAADEVGEPVTSSTDGAVTTATEAVAPTPPTLAAVALPDLTERLALPARTTVVDATTFGATPNDDTDDTAAIQKALDSLTGGGWVELPAGNYVQAGVLRLTGAGVVLSGAQGADASGVVLTATDPKRQAVLLTGADTAVTSLTLTSTAPDRGDALEDHRIVLDGSDGSIVTGVDIDGSAAVGIFAYGARNYTISDNVVANTNADGIHNTNGSQDGVIVNNTVQGVGDDCIAVVSYLGDGKVTSAMTIQDNTCDGTEARGISVVGGEEVLIAGNTISDTAAAGIYLASEDSFQTYAPHRIKVAGNTVTGANTDTAIDHAGIFMYARGGDATSDGAKVSLQIEDVLIDGNAIVDTASNNGISINNPFARNVVIQNSAISGPKDKNPIRVVPDPDGIALEGNFYNGTKLADALGGEGLISTVKSATAW